MNPAIALPIVLCFLLAAPSCTTTPSNTGDTAADALVDSVDAPGADSEVAGPDADSGPSCQPLAASTLEEALATGDASCVAESALLDEALAVTAAHRAFSCELLNGLYGTGSVNYAPGNRSQLLINGNTAATAIVTGNGGSTLGLAGDLDGTRYAALGASPAETFVAGANLAFEAPFARLLAWLLTGTASDAPLAATHTVATAFMHSPDGSDLTTWIGQKAPGWTVTSCDEATDLATCFGGVELVVIGWDANGADPTAVTAAVQGAMTSGVPVLYLHTWYEDRGPLSDALSRLLRFELPYGGNFWDDDAASWTGVSETPGGTEMPCFDADLDEALPRLLGHLKASDFALDWSVCDDDWACEAMPDLAAEFRAGAEVVRTFNRGLEAGGVDPFADPGRRLEKLATLLGDKLRAGISYPMHHGVTDDTTLLRAWYADHAALITRPLNPPQPDLGSFSPTVAPAHPAVTSVFTVPPRAVEFSTSAEVYALPGRTLTVTRTDAGSVSTWICVNRLRGKTSHIFDADTGYDRPAFLEGTLIPLVAGVPLKLTSPYGGLVFVRIEAADTELPEAVALQFEGVARHPVYSGPGTEAAFTTALAATQLGWAELKTPGVEVHSTVAKMQESVAAYHGDVAQLAAETWEWVYQDLYGLTGKVGTDLTHPATVSAFCTARGWDCDDPSLHGMRNVQHVNADRAQCGYGCSGNPYDQFWAFTPLGWGESHEIGHNQQIGLLKVYGGASGEVSNNIFPVHKWWRWNAQDGVEKQGRELGFGEVYTLLQSAQSEADPAAFVKTGLWEDLGVFRRLVFYWQFVMNNRDVPELGDGGWDLVRLLYLEARLFDQARDGEDAWLAARDGLGFSLYTHADAETLPDPHDFLLVASSFITGRDQRGFFGLYGVSWSATADAQLDALSLAAAPLGFWVVPDEEAFSDPLPAPLPIDGTTLYPTF